MEIPLETNPTKITYLGFIEAYDYFNDRLFDNNLLHCLITMQRKAGANGYFANKRFGTRDATEITDEIALNPAHFKQRDTTQILSTLVHEMCHLEQHHFGHPSRAGYHNREWVEMMHRVGLIASASGKEGGKQTWQRMTHYIERGGAFGRACRELIECGHDIRYVELSDPAVRKKKAETKSKYTCDQCHQHAWGKTDLKLRCDQCDVPMRLIC
jgi:predicted SprT family Zn-dependent metalloprotease